VSEIQGTAAAETLFGTAGADTIVGNGGADVIYAGRGGDSVTGGDDVDYIYGEAGNDSIDGGGGNDVLYGGAGDDVVHGGSGDDYIWSGERTGSDTLHGDSGDDTFRIIRSQGSGTIAAYGGAGHDHFTLGVGTGASVSVDGGDGDDYISLSNVATAATLTLGSGRDLVTLATLAGSAANPATRPTITDFATGPGGDVVDLASALRNNAPSWDGVTNPFAAGLLSLAQSGSDSLLKYNGATILIFKNVGAASFTADNFGGVAPDGSVSPARSLTGDDDGNILAGGSGDDVIDGGKGPDHIYGGYGADTLAGGDGNDSITGGAGNDVLNGGAGVDGLSGGFGDDIVHGGAGDDNLYDNDSGVDSLYGDEGDDYFYAQRDGSHSGGSSSMFGGEGDDRFTVITRSADPLFIDGGAGNDTISMVTLTGSLAVTLGAGADLVDLTQWTWTRGGSASITIADFDPGEGDRLELAEFLHWNSVFWENNYDPFGTGALARLVQSGTDVLLQVSTGAGADSILNLVTFRNSLVADITTASLGGMDLTGADIAGVTVTGGGFDDRLTGDGGSDTVDGLGGNDVIYGLFGDDTLSGGDGRDVIHGGFGDDVIDGGDGDDVLYGDEGDDIVSGGAGRDYLEDTSGGEDALLGGDGDDTIYAYRDGYIRAGGMLLDGGAGDDYIQVNNHIAMILVSGGDGTDVVDVLGSEGELIVSLGAGQDVLRFGTSYVFPQSGSSHYGLQLLLTDFEAGDGGDQIDLDGWLSTDLRNYDTSLSPFAAGFLTLYQSGSDVVLTVKRGEQGTYEVPWMTFKNTDAWSLTAYNFEGYETNFQMVHGSAVDETFTGGTGNDGFDGGGGNDTFLLGYGGYDKAVGGDGNDTFFIALPSAVTGRYVVSGAGGSDVLQVQGHSSFSNLTLGTPGQFGNLVEESGIETIRILSGFDNSRGWALGETIFYGIQAQDNATPAGGVLTIDASGLAASEKLTLLTDETDSSLFVTGGAGADILNGGALADTLIGGGGNDYLNGGGGADTLRGGGGNDSYFVDSLADTVVELAGEGTDDVRTALGTNAAIYTLAANVENLTGMSNAGQTVAGNALDNVLTMGGGNDVLDLSAGGNDMASGGGGNDYIYFGAAFTADDVIVGGAGTDTVGLLGNYNLTLGANTLSGVETFSLLSGTAAGGTEHVTYSITTVDANVPAGGRLTVYAGGLLADESLFFNGYAETDGALSVYGGAGNDTFAGGPANDAFVGGAGDDTMYGLGGMDWLEGGLGADTMRGGPGNDVFVYQSAAESTAAKTDHIVDFEYVSDHIVLTNVDANSNAAGDQAFSFIGSNAFSHTAGELRAYQSGASWFVEGDVDGDGNADLVIQVDPVAGHAIIASDFLL